jgi:hypothetical protein
MPSLITKVLFEESRSGSLNLYRAGPLPFLDNHPAGSRLVPIIRRNRQPTAFECSMKTVESFFRFFSLWLVLPVRTILSGKLREQLLLLVLGSQHQHQPIGLFFGRPISQHNAVGNEELFPTRGTVPRAWKPAGLVRLCPFLTEIAFMCWPGCVQLLQISSLALSQVDCPHVEVC